MCRNKARHLFIVAEDQKEAVADDRVCEVRPTQRKNGEPTPSNPRLRRWLAILGRKTTAWLESALSPLPETFRISHHRSDRAWTIEQVKAMGAKAIPWMPEETAFTMPFARGKATEGHDQRMMALLHETGRITRQEAASMLPGRTLDVQRG